MCAGAPVATASTTDAQATYAYLSAQHRLLTALLHDSAAARDATSAAATQVARECPEVVSGMPPAPMSPEALSALVKGENARLSLQKQTLESELIAAVAHPGDSLYVPAEEAFAAEVRQLSWSNPAIAPAVQTVAQVGLERASAPAPAFCADAKAWAQSDYRTLSGPSREFEAARSARRNSEVEAASLRALLKPYENASDRALIRLTETVEAELVFGGASDLTTISKLYRAVGFPQIQAAEPKLVTVGHGYTAAGTRFEVSSGSSAGPAGSCRRSATIAYTRPGESAALIVGGPNNPICLSSPRYRHPALFCEEGIETIQTAVPPSVRSARLVLADGRKIQSRVLRVPHRDGGPAGIYAQEIRGGESHAVSLLELDTGGAVVLALKLPRYRCVKARTEPEGLFTVTALAHGRTPEGEPFTISAFGSLDGEPLVSVDTGVDPELDEPATGSNQAFPWSIKIGCAPHPFAILYGVLRPPGQSVTVRTAQGTVALNATPIEPSLHAKGPLVYGVLAAPPAELTVLGADGSTLYTEDLQRKDMEAAQFCEGYAEP